jgi:hypothetical protein
VKPAAGNVPTKKNEKMREKWEIRVDQGCQIVPGKTYQNGKNVHIPNNHKYIGTKWPQNTPSHHKIDQTDV